MFENYFKLLSLLVNFCCYLMGLVLGPCLTESCYVVWSGPDLEILLLLLPESWHFRHEPSHPDLLVNSVSLYLKVFFPYLQALQKLVANAIKCTYTYVKRLM
jgi:hypothetical protein